MNQITATMPKVEYEVPTPTPASDAASANLHTGPLTVSNSSTFAIRESREASRIAKVLFDFTLSLTGIILLLPVFFVIALCIRLDSGGPILHFREIVGLHGRRFYALKFRTMIPNAEAYLTRHPDLLQKFQQNMK